MITFRYEGDDPSYQGITHETSITCDANADDLMTAFYCFLLHMTFVPETLHEYFDEDWLRDKGYIPEPRYEGKAPVGEPGWDEEDPLDDMERRIINEDQASPVER